MTEREIDLTSARSFAFYRFARWVASVLFFYPWRVVIRGAERLPTQGAFILAPSHRSLLDIPWAARVTPRRVRFIGKASLYRMPILGKIFTTLGGFSVERDGSDRSTLRAAIASLKSGDIIAIFPEGTRQTGESICDFQPGAAYLAIKAQVPVIPIGLAGTETPGGRLRLPRFQRGVMLIGEPLFPPVIASSVVKRELVEEFSAAIKVELQRLFDDAAVLRSEFVS